MIEQETVNIASSPSPTPSGIFDTLKGRFDMQSVIQKVKLSKDQIYEGTLFAGIGLVSGYLLKRYFSYVVTAVLVVIALWALQRYGVTQIAINWDRVRELSGIQLAPDVTANTILGKTWEWMKVNVVISISYFVGFLVGLKLG